MATLRMDHVVVVVEDMASARAFFEELGLELEAEMPIGGKWVDRINGIDGIDVHIAMMRTPDGSGKLELTTFKHPTVIATQPAVMPPNALGLRSVMFEVDGVAATMERLRKHGGELVGEIADDQDIYRLCYLRGPGGAIIALAQSLR